MVGKLTNDYEMSCSILATAAGYNPWKSRIDLLGEMILAKRGENVRTEQTAIMSRGDTLEPVLLTKAGEELGLSKVETDIELPIRHADIPLQGSLDGLCWSDGITITEDTTKGIYVMTDSKEITIEGRGVMECLSRRRTSRLARPNATSRLNGYRLCRLWDLSCLLSKYLLALLYI